MKIKFITTVSGPGIRYVRGVTYDVPKNQAKEYLDARFATVAVEAADSREKATRVMETR